LEGAKDYFLASESIALRQLGFTDITDIKPGQAVFIEKGGVVHFRQIIEQRSYTPDSFEYIYFSRPETMLDGISVHRSRQNMGAKLANKLRETLGEEGLKDIDIGMKISHSQEFTGGLS
jgi:amidophosphoribosyltransferase